MSIFNDRVQKSLEELEVRSLDDGQDLIVEGASFDSVYFLKSGALQVSKNGVDLTRVSDRGAVFGEMSYFLERPAMAAVRAVGPAEVYVATAPGVFFMDHPAALVYVARNMANRIDGLNSHLASVKKHLVGEEPDIQSLVEELNSIIT